MTDLDTSTQSDTEPRPRALVILAVGLFGGFALGVIARGWMRLISDDPEFTWAGTIFIVAGFTIFGFAQSVVAVARTHVRRRWVLNIVRVVGIVVMLPLFFAAGATMFPTVIGLGLARARVDWYRWVRALLVIVGLVPIVVVARQLIDDFGWSLQSFVGFVVMLGIYAVIIWATQFAFAPVAREKKT